MGHSADCCYFGAEVISRSRNIHQSNVAEHSYACVPLVAMGTSSISVSNSNQFVGEQKVYERNQIQEYSSFRTSLRFDDLCFDDLCSYGLRRRALELLYCGSHFFAVIGARGHSGDHNRRGFFDHAIGEHWRRSRTSDQPVLKPVGGPSHAWSNYRTG
jgi:hypothetical protein